MQVEKLIPEIKDNIWGGVRLIEKYGKQTDKRPCAESWELSLHKDGESRLESGEPLSSVLDKWALGENASDFEFFPMLIKFIDARDNLSVQVHPSDSYALKNENSYGKTEMWYIVDCDEGAGIYLGFSRDVNEGEVRAAIEDNSLTSLMNFFPVKPGECYFIPSGTIHAIGAGVLILEIQQNSNLTYRVYDYGRLDKNGKPRELHVEKALKVLNYKKYTKRALSGNLLGISKYFAVTRHTVSGETHFPLDSRTFRSLSVTEGSGTLNGIPVSAGDSYFIPATEKSFTLDGNLTAVIAEVRKYSLTVQSTENAHRVTVDDDLGRRIYSAYGESPEILSGEALEALNLTESDVTFK